MPRKAKTGQTLTNTTLVTTTETVVATVSGVSLPAPGITVRVQGRAQLTTGVGTTTVTPRIRRGTDATGALVGEGNPVTIGAAAGGTEDFGFEADDTPGEVADQSYVFTLQQAAATGNGTALAATASAEWDQ